MVQVSQDQPRLLPGNSYSAGVIQLDPYLEPFRDALRHRFGLVESWIKKINENEGGLDKFSKVRILHIYL
jgi:1,4-alpha-glucan branching enzyme